MMLRIACAAALCALSWAGTAPKDKVTVLYDSSAAGGLTSGWGYAAFVEYRGQRILFDAGPDRAQLETNAKALGVDLKKLDFVVITHDDPDHYGGLDAIYAANPRVPVYVPDSDSGAFGLGFLNHIYRAVEALVPGRQVVNPPPGLNYVRVARTIGIAPGMRLIPFPFDGAQRREQMLVLDAEGGVTLLTGCSHPGIANMVRSAGTPVKLVAGGFHLTTSSEADVRAIVGQIKQAGAGAVMPGHCTGRFATAELHRVFGANFNVRAAGGTLALP